MNKVLLTVLSIFLVSSLSFAELELNLSGETTQTIINKNLESNLNLTLPSEVVAPVDMQELVKGLMLLGVLGDVSFPFGDADSGFKHIAGTAWSGHVEFSYFVSPVFRIMLRAGYTNFGKQSDSGTEDLGFGDPATYSYEDTFSQIPILVGGYYMFQTGSGFKPYIGLAIGVFFQTWKVNWQYSYDPGFGEPYNFNLDNSFTNTGFGIVPGLGAYYMAGSVLIQLAVEYTYIFSDAPTAEYTVDYGLGKVSNITQYNYTEEDTPVDKPSYFSVVAGVSFPLGK